MGRVLYIFALLCKYYFLYLIACLPSSKLDKGDLLVRFFEQASGTFVKLGQILALRPDLIPKEYILRMMDLFDNVKPFPYSEVRQIFLSELGDHPDKLFAHFEEVPFASASFGQVHAARLESGKVVVVKVQRPGIREMVRSDFMFIEILILVFGRFIKIEGLAWSEFVAEFKTWTLKELDYLTEASYVDRVYESTRTSNRVVTPRTFQKYLTSKILVQDYIDGVPLSRVMKEFRSGKMTIGTSSKMGLDIKSVLKNMIHEMMRQYFFDDFFHADPHPGNIIILDKGRIGIVDFGIVGVPAPFRKEFRLFMRAYAVQNIEEAGYYFIQFAGEEIRSMMNAIVPPNSHSDLSNDIMRLLAKDFEQKLQKTMMNFQIDLRDMKIDYSIMLLQILKMVNKYNIRLPSQIATLLRSLSIIGFMAKELDSEFKLTSAIGSFFDEYPEESFPKVDVVSRSYRKMSREAAIEKLQAWVLNLMETEPELYTNVHKYITSLQLSHV